jgi:hypothetical protein
VRRVIANQTEEERASANERNRQRMAQIRAEEPDNLLYLHRQWNNKKYCMPTSIVKLYILETCAFSFLSFPFNQTEPQQRVAWYG